MKLEFCVACGSEDDLQHHHLVMRSEGGSEHEANLITLCRSCHDKVHERQGVYNHRQRVRAGLRRAVDEGKQLGRPRLDADLEARIKEALNEPGRPGVREIAKQFGVAPGHGAKDFAPFRRRPRNRPRRTMK